MNLSVGIVGLPNVGKSSLFNLLLKRQVAQIGDYPFTTIEPNVGVVEVPDQRLFTLQQLENAKKVVPAIVKFVDIAGLVKGAAQGEGLGNQFLSYVREVDAICHVVRYFDDPNIAHVHGKVDPAFDIAVIQTELIMADLQTLDKQPEPKGAVERTAALKWKTIQKLKDSLDTGQLAKDVPLTIEERNSVRDLHLLTEKPVIYVFNISEKQLASHAYDGETLAREFKVTGPVICICEKVELDLGALTEEEAKEYLQEAGLSHTGLERLIKVGYDTLGLITFFTAGPKEVHAWTIKAGTKAPDAAAEIHTDFKRGFIKAEVVSFDHYAEAGSCQKAKEKGWLRLEGKEYIFQDGDVVEFKFNV